jgi:hypothetical protein
MRCCCNEREPSAPPPRPSDTAPRTGWRRMAALVQWAIPVTVLALVPKCPMCVAAYVVLFTGIGLSLPAAAAIRWALIALSIAAIAYLLVRALWRLVGPVRA